MKQPPRHLIKSRPKSVNYLAGFWSGLARDIIKSVLSRKSLVHLKPSLLKGRFSFKGNLKLNFKQWLKKKDRTITIRIKWVWAALLLLALWPRPSHVIYADPIAPAPPSIKLNLKALKPLAVPAVSHVEALQSLPEPQAVSAPVSAPAPAPAPVNNAPAGCGDNFYANYIYMHESGCSTTVTNSLGCLGIGQACPGSKLLAVCPNEDYACENAFFTAYANAVYGGWAGAYSAWLSKSWW